MAQQPKCDCSAAAVDFVPAPAVPTQSQLYAQVVEIMPAALLLLEITATVQRIISINHAGEVLLGCEREHLLGLELAQLAIFADKAAVVAALQQLQHTDSLDNIRLQIRKCDGSVHDLSLSAVAFKHEHCRQAVLIFGDCTFAKQAEAQLQVALNHADAANRAKSAFLANMSHEIRTPLNAICGFASMLARAPQGEQTRELAEIIVSAGRDLTSLLNAVLMQSRLEADRLEIEHKPFALAMVLDAVGMEARWRLGDKPVKFACTVAADLGDWFCGDASCLRQILTALVDNAVKFTAAGIVALHVRRHDHPDSAHMLDFVVGDTGIGIAPNEVQRIFESFNQADSGVTRRYSGAGLGLSIARGLAARLKGDISVVSCPGQGTQFTLSLPLPPAAC